MDPVDPQSVTFWLDALRDDHPDALEVLWTRYFLRLAQLADRMLGERRRLVDGEDIAVSVFHALSEAARQNHLESVQDREELWRLLVTMTRRKLIDELRHEQRAKRGGGAVRGESAFLQVNDLGINAAADAEPTPQFLCMMDEEFRRLLDLLGDPLLRDVALARLEGYTTKEISERLAISLRSVERKLELIRKRWLTTLDEAQGSADCSRG